MSCDMKNTCCILLLIAILYGIIFILNVFTMIFIVTCWVYNEVINSTQQQLEQNLYYKYKTKAWIILILSILLTAFLGTLSILFIGFLDILQGTTLNEYFNISYDNNYYIDTTQQVVNGILYMLMFIIYAFNSALFYKSIRRARRNQFQVNVDALLDQFAQQILFQHQNNSDIEVRNFSFQSDLAENLITQFDDTENCAICIEQYEEKQKLIKLKCHHYFHNNCIREWMAKHATCPICRAPVSA